jgi:hypothetical protein
VVPAAGESAEALAELCAAVRRELRPSGVIAERLADRVALTLLRLDRVIRYEAAVASAAGTTNLPLDPDAVTGAGVDLCLPAPGPDAPPVTRLAYARARLGGWLPAREACRAAVEALDSGRGPDPLALPGACPVRREIEDALGWTWEEALQKWKAVARDGAPTAAGFRRLLAELARQSGKSPQKVPRVLRERLAAAVAEYDAPIARMTAEAERLAAEMRAARERVAAAAVFADGEAVERVVRLEAHLMRQLRQTLDELDRLRGEDARDCSGGLGVLVGKVLAGVPRSIPLPAAVGSFRNDADDGGAGAAAVVLPLRGPD